MYKGHVRKSQLVVFAQENISPKTATKKGKKNTVAMVTKLRPPNVQTVRVYKQPGRKTAQ